MGEVRAVGLCGGVGKYIVTGVFGLLNRVRLVLVWELVWDQCYTLVGQGKRGVYLILKARDSMSCGPHSNSTAPKFFPAGESWHIERWRLPTDHTPTVFITPIVHVLTS